MPPSVKIGGLSALEVGVRGLQRARMSFLAEQQPQVNGLRGFIGVKLLVDVAEPGVILQAGLLIAPQPGVAEADGIGVAAPPAGAVAGRQRRRLVEEAERGVAARVLQGQRRAGVVQPADDPGLAVPGRLPGLLVMAEEPAPVAQEQAPALDAQAGRNTTARWCSRYSASGPNFSGRRIGLPRYA